MPGSIHLPYVGSNSFVRLAKVIWAFIKSSAYSKFILETVAKKNRSTAIYANSIAH
jgi:hypothetical protein